ncbi:desulfoferrodoxin [bacterium]|nr:desulfoferrodoxin [bacterium]
MASEYTIYKCNMCGIIIEVLNGDKGHLVCCGQDMEKLEEKTVDGGKEKHVPVANLENGKLMVKVGDVEHPMVDDHYIEWIEVECCGGVFRKHLKPGEKPAAEFSSCCENYKVREYCSKHGLWTS